VDARINLDFKKHDFMSVWIRIYGLPSKRKLAHRTQGGSKNTPVFLWVGYGVGRLKKRQGSTRTSGFKMSF
jgi:hypothetical protein